MLKHFCFICLASYLNRTTKRTVVTWEIRTLVDARHPNLHSPWMQTRQRAREWMRRTKNVENGWYFATRPAESRNHRSCSCSAATAACAYASVSICVYLSMFLKQPPCPLRARQRRGMLVVSGGRKIRICLFIRRISSLNLMSLLKRSITKVKNLRRKNSHHRLVSLEALGCRFVLGTDQKHEHTHAQQHFWISSWVASGKIALFQIFALLRCMK